MRAFLTISTALACVFALSASDMAVAKPKRGSGQVSLGGDDVQIPLPKNLTSNKDYLDDGASRDMRPDAEDNDRYFLEQENFANQDPTRYSEWGSVMDQYQPY